MELVNIDDLKEMEYDGVTFDMQAVKKRAFELVAKSPGYMNLLKVNVHRILNDEYAANVIHGERDIIKRGPKLDACRFIAPGPRIKACRIIAPGPSLSTEWPNLNSPEDMFTIACNKAVELAAKMLEIALLPGPTGNENVLWLVTDDSARDCDWFKRALGLTPRAREEWEEPRTPSFYPFWHDGDMCCFPTDSLQEFKPQYTMHVAPCMPPQYDQRLLQGVILNGATIAGMALQIAFYLGAKKIELCGVDLEGDTYYDGSSTGGNHSWDEFRTRMNNFIKVIQHQGVEVYSRTETTLDIEVRNG